MQTICILLQTNNLVNTTSLNLDGLPDTQPTKYKDWWQLTDTHQFNGPLSRTTRVSQYQKVKTDLDFTEAINSSLLKVRRTKPRKWRTDCCSGVEIPAADEVLMLCLGRGENTDERPPYKRRASLVPPNRAALINYTPPHSANILKTYNVLYNDLQSTASVQHARVYSTDKRTEIVWNIIPFLTSPNGVHISNITLTVLHTGFTDSDSKNTMVLFNN